MRGPRLPSCAGVKGRGLTSWGAFSRCMWSAYIELLQGKRAAPTVKQHLACIRHAVRLARRRAGDADESGALRRGPRHSVTKGVTPVLSSEEATALLTGMDVSTVVGLRDRVIIAVMTYTFARVGAVVALSPSRITFRRKNAGGCAFTRRTASSMKCPVHHKLEEYLDAYINAAGKRCSAPRSARPRNSPRGRYCAGTSGVWCDAALLMRELKRP